MSTTVEQLLGSGPILPMVTPRISPITRWSIGALGLFLILGLSVAASRLSQDSELFPVTNVDVLGTVDYENRDALKQVVYLYVEQGFYGLNIDDVRQSLEQLPWVVHAQVSRVWPGRIEVRVEEHEPAARWNDDSLISKRLELLVPPQLQVDSERYEQWRELFSTLPRVYGAPGRHSILLVAHRNYQRSLARIGVSLDVLREDGRLSQTLELSSEVTVQLGYEDRELRMNRFLDVYERLVGRPDRTASKGDGNARGPVTFDMRYSNGFALGGIDSNELRSFHAGQSSRSVPEQPQ